MGTAPWLLSLASQGWRVAVCFPALSLLCATYYVLVRSPCFRLSCVRLSVMLLLLTACALTAATIKSGDWTYTASSLPRIFRGTLS